MDPGSTDEHELTVLPDGSYFLVGLRSQQVDMSQYVSGGNSNASVGETCIQGFTPAGELVFQFRAWDHFDIRDLELDDVRGASMRFPHMNAIDVDEDGNIVLSSRHISEVTKIDRDSGEIIWRLGGAHSDFRFVNDPLNGFRSQHAVRSVGRGHYTLFDNGDLHNPPVSRAAEYQVDLRAMTARLVWQFRDAPDKYSYYMGNVQRLPNGNTLINWAVGDLPKLTEVRPDGTKAFEMNWVDQWEAYRVWRCPWQGVAAKPYLILEPLPDNVTLIFNKFGDPNVAYYRIYAGTSPQPTSLFAISTSTLKRLTDLENERRYYFRVTAVDVHGLESEYSNEENTLVNMIEPGQNMVLNGDFSQAKAAGTWAVSGSASAQWIVDDGVSRFDISAGGSQSSDIQLAQAGMKLTKGQQYVFEFDAWADQPRTIEVRVERSSSPSTDYGRIGYLYVTPQKKHWRYYFVMQDLSDYDARIVFNLGTSTRGVYLDNVSLSTPLPGDFDFDGHVGFRDFATLAQEWHAEQSSLCLSRGGWTAW